MADFRSSIIIKKPLQEVFQYMVDMENATEVMVNVVEVEKITEGPIGAGTKYLETRSIRGKKAKAEIEYTQFEENQSYTASSEVNGLEVTYYYQFHEVEEGTHVEFEANIHTTGLFMKLTKPFIVNIIRKEDGNHLQYVKEALEK
ncbi:SRPBCC family protein [Bacillus sp. 03113]|uniref:SRPBCC family protein n=1 Tax=Bacillus sp. 03113 TaxID=2578211 RepID=UPI0011450411|nr:SRPBCC family protein [Bacillus sp. 03113]